MRPGPRPPPPWHSADCPSHGDPAADGSRQASRGGISQRRRQRTGRARGNADRPHAAALSALATIARYDERGGESPESHPPREAECEALAWWADDAALGRRRRARSRQRLPAAEGACRYAQTRRRSSCPRSAGRPRCLSGARRVESQPSRRRISTAGRTSPQRTTSTSNRVTA